MRAPLLALLAGCSGAAALPDGPVSTPDATPDTAAPDAGADAGPPFSFVLDRTHLSLVGGDSAPVGLRVTRQAGFTGTITVEALGLPAGVVAPPVLVKESEQSLTFSAELDVEVQTVTVTVRAAGGGFEAEQPLILIPQPYPDFAMAYAPAPLLVARGSATPLVATVERGGDDTKRIDVTLAGLPPGVTASPNPFVIGHAETSRTLTLEATGDAELGSFTLFASSSNGGRGHVDAVAVTVGPAPAFTVTTPAPLILAQGTTAQATIEVVRDAGFVAPLTVTASPDPRGVTSASAAIAAGASSTLLAFSAAADARLVVPSTVIVTVSDGATARTAPLVVQVAPATPSSLDPTFGLGGVVMAQKKDYDGFHAVLATGGGLLVGGTQGRIWRFLDDGTQATVLDTPYEDGVWHDGDRDAQGRALFCAIEHDRLIVVRLFGSSVDTSFGTDGYAEVDPHVAVAELAGCRALPDGGVLLAASVGNPADLLVVRLSATGATTDLDVADAGGNDLAYGVSLQGEQPLIALTRNPPIGPSIAVVARFTAAGALDPSFDGDGLRILPGTHAIGAGATPDGITVLGGNFNTLTVWRLDGTSGALLGSSELAPGGAAMDRAERVHVLPDGAVLAAGHVDDQFGVFLVTPGGSLDAAFSTRFGDNNRMALDATLDAAGRIVVAGTSDADHGALARYLP